MTRIKLSWLNWRRLIIDAPDLSFGAKSMALYLNTYMNDSQDMAFPSLERIIGEMNLGSKTTAIKYLNDLCENGYLQRQKRFGNSCVYYAAVPHSITESVLMDDSTVVQNLEHSSPESETTVVQNLEPNNQENNQSNNQVMQGGKRSIPPCPYQKIIDLYHEKLPMCPKVVVLSDLRKRALNARWRNGMHGMDNWELYFDDVSRSKFLTGQVDPPPGRRQFIADFDFLIRESTIVKTQEGKYHRA